MTETSLDSSDLSTIVVVEFPAGQSTFTGEMVDELVALVDSRHHPRDRRADPHQERGRICRRSRAVRRPAASGALQQIEAELAELLAADDVEHLAAAMEPGSTAGVLIWENLWAAGFASAARRSGGQLIADGRIPIQAILASIEADLDLDDEES